MFSAAGKVATQRLGRPSTVSVCSRAAAARSPAAPAAVPSTSHRFPSSSSPTPTSISTRSAAVQPSRSSRSSIHSSSRRFRMASTAAGTTASTGSGTLLIERVPCLSDNYSWLLHEPEQGVTAVVDPAEVQPVVAALQAKGWNLTHILNTHHHFDHVGGNQELKKQYGCTIVGPAADATRIPGIDVALKDGDSFQLGSAQLLCYDTPGHTRGHVTYYCAASKALFPGDTLFSLGCGRLFEGTPAQMWASLSKLLPLPPDTRVCCAHEYTASNAKFAASVDPGNPDLQRMKADIEAKRARGEPTVPSLLGDEFKCNPFLRPGSAEIRAALGVPADASDADAFGAIRAAKDSFR